MYGMGPRFELRQTAALRPEQKKALKQILRLAAELRDVPPSEKEIKRGLEGLKIGREMLLKENAVGLLIGGLSEAAWKPNATPDQLAAHKDVDIMVLSKAFKLKEKFDGGIDWWMPHEERVSIKERDNLKYEKRVNWWENGNGVRLAFGAHTTPTNQLTPGLYVPGRDSIVTMRYLEAIAQLDPRVEPDANSLEIEEAFRRKIERELGKKIMPAFMKDFEEYILDEKYENNQMKANTLDFDGFDWETYGAIKNWEEEPRVIG
jgi:hypothetical protein